MKLDFPSTRRNRQAILNVLSKYLQNRPNILEVASGSGQHAFYFTEKQKNLQWQPSDIAPENLASINSYHQEAKHGLLQPIKLDVLDEQWDCPRYDMIVCINMMHISPRAAAKSLFNKAKKHINKDGVIYLYGPYFEDEVKTAASNIEFDQSLKQRNCDWGIWRRQDIETIASTEGFSLVEKVAMPSNNLSLIFQDNKNLLSSGNGKRQ